MFPLLLIPTLLAPLPPGTPVISPDSATAFSLVGAVQDGQSRVVNVSGQPFRLAIQVQTVRTPSANYLLQLNTKTIAPVRRGDTLLVTFYARQVAAGPEGATTEMVFERASQPFEKSVSVPAVLTPKWQEFREPFKALASYAAGEAQVNFRLGYPPQTIDIAAVSVQDFGPTVAPDSLPVTAIHYQGESPDAPWRKAAEERIRKYRMANLDVRVVDTRGRPVRGAQVQATMLRHAFGFGSAVNADLLNGSDAVSRKYQSIVLSLFNKAVFENDLKWPEWEQNRDGPIQATHWLVDHHIAVRGHNLLWPSWYLLPRDVQPLRSDPKALRQAILNHIADEVGALKGLISEWDVVNEPVANTSVTELLGQRSLADWYVAAHAADPAPTLFVNDYNILAAGGRDTAHQDAYFRIIQQLLAEGAPLGGIGVQCHFDSELTPPVRLLQILDRFASFGLPIEVTELDIDVPDPVAQANYMRDFLTLAFSYPKIESIVMWGFWEARHWKPNAALFRRDWSIKPVGRAWEELVLHKWWTRASGRTNDAGDFRARGFLGDYRVTVSQNGRTRTIPLTLKTGGAGIRVTIGQ